VQFGDVSSEIPGASAEPDLARYSQLKDDCSNVVSMLPDPEENAIASQLEAARALWLRTGDEKTLRRALLDLLRYLERTS
jgi:hypothetical protein